MSNEIVDFNGHQLVEKTIYGLFEYNGDSVLSRDSYSVIKLFSNRDDANESVIAYMKSMLDLQPTFKVTYGYENGNAYGMIVDGQTQILILKLNVCKYAYYERVEC